MRIIVSAYHRHRFPVAIIIIACGCIFASVELPQVGGKTVTQSVAACRLVNLCCPQSILNSSRKHEWNARRPLGPFDVLSQGNSSLRTFL